MYDFFQGAVAELTATNLVLELNGIGYSIQISTNTYADLKEKKEAKVYVYQVLKEDSNQLFGFLSKKERQVFLKLISVSGIGSNTARVFLSSMTCDQVVDAIVNQDEKLLTSVKGVGLKTAQRVIVELKDKFATEALESPGASAAVNNTRRASVEATTALELLGFNKKAAEKAVTKILQKDSQISVEDLIKQSLKIL